LKDYAFDLETKLNEIEAVNKQKAEAKKTKAITAGDTISVHYTGTYDN
jgi:FKBP-type peptidyl-prolyl cis-trans isomerase